MKRNPLLLLLPFVLLAAWFLCIRPTIRQKDAPPPPAENTEAVAPAADEPPAAPDADTSEASDPDAPERAENLAAVQKEFEARSALVPANPDLLALPGLIANRADRTVEITVEATGIATNAIVEFFLIGLESGHDYESLFVSFAKAKDISRALQFLGMSPGRNALALPMAFWPKGERVRAALKLPDGSRIPLESMVFDRGSEKEGATLPESGFVYCGSSESRSAPGELAADTEADGPCSIISVYNEPTTLLDVPRQASQAEVYETFLANPVPAMRKGVLLRVELRPEERSAERGPRVRDYVLSLRKGADGTAEYAFAPASDSPSAWLDSTALLDALKAAAEDHDPFVTMDFSDDLTCGDAATAAKLLSLVDTEGCIHVEPPKSGQLYYRAFLPREEWRDRAKRPTQALELRFAPGSDGVFAAAMVSIREIWPEDGESLSPTLQIQETPAPSPEAFAKLSADSGNDIPALLVFAPADAPLGQTMPYLRAVLDSRPNAYFFVEK